MRTGKPGPVLLDLPLDVQQAEIDFNIDAYEPLPVEKPCATDAEIAEVVKMLSEAKAPILIMGGGVTLSESESALIDVAEALNVPIIQTYMAKGGVPLAHRLNAGHMGIQVGQPLGNRMFLDSDLVLAVGCRFSDRHTGGIAVYRGERKFIHVDIERTQIGKVFQPDLGVVSDAGLFLKKLLGALKAAEFKPFPDARIEAMNAMRASMERKTDYDDCPIMPHRVFHEVNRGFDSDTMFTAGCGITQIWGGQLQKIDKPMRYLPSGGAGTLGYEIPAAFGAKVAHPERTSVTVVGDFGFTFLGEEIAVSAVYGKPIIVVILNNAYLGLIRQNQKGAYGFEYAVDMPYNQDGRIDYVKVAEGFGCLAERVFTPDDLRSAIQRAKASGRTYVIDAVCVQKQLSTWATPSTPSSPSRRNRRSIRAMRTLTFALPISLHRKPPGTHFLRSGRFFLSLTWFFPGQFQRPASSAEPEARECPRFWAAHPTAPPAPPRCPPPRRCTAHGPWRARTRRRSGRRTCTVPPPATRPLPWEPDNDRECHIPRA